MLLKLMKLCVLMGQFAPTPPKVTAVANPTGLVFTFNDEDDEELANPEMWLVQVW